MLERRKNTQKDYLVRLCRGHIWGLRLGEAEEDAGRVGRVNGQRKHAQGVHWNPEAL